MSGGKVSSTSPALRVGGVQRQGQAVGIVHEVLAWERIRVCWFCYCAQVCEGLLSGGMFYSTSVVRWRRAASGLSRGGLLARGVRVGFAHLRLAKWGVVANVVRSRLWA